MIRRGGSQLRRVRRTAGDALPQTFMWRGWSCLCPPQFQKYLIKYKLKCLQCFPLFVLAPVLCV